MFRGDKVVLRPLDLKDVDSILRWYSDLEQNILTGWSSLRSIPYMRERIEKRILNPPEDTISMIIEVSELPIGKIDLVLIDWNQRRGEIGILIDKPYRRKGYGKDAVITFLQYLFHIRNMHKVMGYAYDFNKASTALFKSVGFVQEGILRKHEYTAGSYRDLIVFGMLKEEFIEKYPGRQFLV
ncbi:MAG: GNAT family N-acetyltransferase [Candidatus Fermentithermobacillus carboniphilus]|uniref:GNAT family N-acetyltransferase n=1 Tax=Candidatus Fermentithermobacillus carboniphilus TaxID=3085328 RepID=A0AAT9LAQ8_9FIRM|nr:MAG: GNAT family N-acetyltransferase [Candidatus Fermentithermobacillus carboniphilus]